MASKLGTVFVEVSLDDRVYKQKLSEQLTSSQATAKGIETSWRALGAKTDAYYEAQRRAYENAMTLIRHSATSTAADILRAEEAKNARLKALNEQQFGHQQSLLDGLKANWIAAGAAIAGAMAIGSKAMDAYELGAKVMQVEESFHLVAKASGESADAIITSMKRASAGTVDDSDIMQKAVKGMVLGLSGDQMTKIMEAARISARVAGEDVKTAYENITDAISTGLPKALKRYGLVSKEEMALVNEALRLGVKEVDLYSMAMQNASIQAMKFGEVNSTAAEGVQRHKAQIQDIKETIGKSLVEAVGAGIDGFNKLDRAFTKWLMRSSGVVMPDEEAAPGAMAGFTSEHQSERIANVEAEKAASLAALKAKTDAAKHAKAEADKIAAADKKVREEARKDTIDGLQAQMDAWDEEAIAEGKRVDERIKEQKRLETEDRKSLIAGIQAQMDSWDDEGKAAGEAIDARKKANADRLTATRNLYQDLTGYGKQYLSASEDLIAKQAEDFRKLGVDEVAIAVWAAQEKQKVFEKYATAEGSTLDRLKARHQKFAREEASIHKAAYDVIDAGAKDLEKQLGDNFFDVLTGNMQRVSLDWETMWSAMARSAANYMAQIATDMAIKQGTQAAIEGAGWLYDLVGGAGGILDFFGGYAEGSIEISKDKLAQLHKGEMVIPAEQADFLRALVEGGGKGSPSDAGFPDLGGFEAPGYVGAFAQGFASSLGRGLVGKELAGLLSGVGLVAPSIGIGMFGKAVISGIMAAVGYQNDLAAVTGMLGRDLSGFFGVDLGLDPSGFMAGGYAMTGAPGSFGSFGGFGGPGGFGFGGGYGSNTSSADSGINGSGEGDEGPGWRTGLDYVPRDNFQARLHEGEAILRKSEADEWRAGGRGKSFTITIPLSIDGREIERIVIDGLMRNGELKAEVRQAALN